MLTESQEQRLREIANIQGYEGEQSRHRQSDILMEWQQIGKITKEEKDRAIQILKHER